MLRMRDRSNEPTTSHRYTARAASPGCRFGWEASVRYFIGVIDREFGGADHGEHEAIDAFNDRLVADGHFILALGISSPTRSVVLDNRGGAGIVTLGPLHDTEEFISGFWLVEVPDDATGLTLAAEGSKACNRRVEARPIA